MRRDYTTGLALVMTIGLAAPALAQRGERPARPGAEMQQGRNAFGGLLRGIELTEEQRQRLEELRAQHRREAGLLEQERPTRPEGIRPRMDSAQGRPGALRGRADSARTRGPDMTRPRPDSPQGRPEALRGRADGPRTRPDSVARPGVRDQPDSGRIGRRPGRGVGEPAQRSTAPSPEAVARALELREQTIADIRSVLTAAQLVQFEKNVKEMQAREAGRGRGPGQIR